MERSDCTYGAILNKDVLLLTEFTNQLLILPALQCLNHSDLNRPYQNLT